MKKVYSILAFLMLVIGVQSQNITTLTFTGRDVNDMPVQLESVVVTNHTQHWQEVLHYPDTVLYLGTSDIQSNELADHISLYQNHPNPFDGTTEFYLQLNDKEHVVLEIFDLAGKSIARYSEMLIPGTHAFKAELASPSTYLLSAKMVGDVAVIKMVNQGYGGDNAIEYLGLLNDVRNTLKKGSIKPYHSADVMEYVGTASINGIPTKSEVINAPLEGSQFITLSFSDAVHYAPKIFLDSITDITITSAKIHCSVLSDGGEAIAKQGICWNTTGFPTVNDKQLVVNNNLSEFTIEMTEDNVIEGQGITYYIRAFAENKMGLSYSPQHSFTTLPALLPIVSTDSTINIFYNSVDIIGCVHSTGGANDVLRGFCWSTEKNPTINDNHTIEQSSDTGSFVNTLTGLSANTTYYVRAYVTNVVGTVYGSEHSFTTTAFICGYPIEDYDKNIYNTLYIGTQCWMKENLRTMHYADGTEIMIGKSTSYDVAYCYGQDIDSEYGLLYNWSATMHNYSDSINDLKGVQGVCPNGWHVPSDAEWTLLIDYISSQDKYWCDSDSLMIAKALAANMDWSSSTVPCAVGNRADENNAIGFNALPAGVWNLGFKSLHVVASFWTSTNYNSTWAYHRILERTTPTIGRNFDYKYVGRSVRCICDTIGGVVELPQVLTSMVDSITTHSAISGGNVISDGGTPVTVRGVCWSTLPKPTINDACTVDSCGTGAYTSRLGNLVVGVTYYVRAYATNIAGTAYGEELCFTADYPNCGTITDYDNNTYNTVLIGNQCWMRENLKTTKYSDGTSISQGSSTSTLVAYCYEATNGLLYNWRAVMRSSSSSSANPSGVEGICPTGWHVPSDAEWTQLTNYVGSQRQYVCAGNTTYIAKALASSTDWKDCGLVGCGIGMISSSNNATGFSAVPAGRYHGRDNYINSGYEACFCSTTEYSSEYAYTRSLICSQADVCRSNINKGAGVSVRCLKD